MTTAADLRAYADRYADIRNRISSLYGDLTDALLAEGTTDADYDRVWRQIDDATVELLKLLNDQGGAA